MSLLMSNAKAIEKRLVGAIFKVNEEQRLVYGWASVIEEDGQPVVDHQGDIIEPAELAKAAHGFMLESRDGGAMHEDIGAHIFQVVESMVFTKDLQKALGIDLKKVGWLIVGKVVDDRVWADVKSGALKAFSIGGRGERTAIE